MRSSGFAAVLFDMDGVLVDSYEQWFRLMNAAASAFDAPQIERSFFERIFGQGLAEDALLFGRSVEDVEGFFDAHFADYLDCVRLNPQAPSVLAALDRARIPTALITNTPSDLARAVMDSVGLSIAVVVGGTDVAKSKPAPDMVTSACSRLQVEAAEVLVVGDSRYDREAASAAGARFAGLGIAGDIELDTLDDVLGYVL